MVIKLYKNLSELNKINKVLNDEIELSAILRDEVTVSDPVLLIESQLNLSDYNYVYIEDFKRYYNITDINIVRTNLWKLYCHVDVLESFKDQILNQKAIISRSQNLYNLYINDNMFVTQNNNNMYIKKFPNKLEAGASIIMVTAGSKIALEE